MNLTMLSYVRVGRFVSCASSLPRRSVFMYSLSFGLLDVSLGQHSIFHTRSTAGSVEYGGGKLSELGLLTSQSTRRQTHCKEFAQDPESCRERDHLGDRVRKRGRHRETGYAPTNFHHLPLRRCIHVRMPSDWDLARGHRDLLFSPEYKMKELFRNLKFSNTPRHVHG
jgi:hypothetical protein